MVLETGCRLSMDGRGAWRDNVFVERLWRSVKYGRVYLNNSAASQGHKTRVVEGFIVQLAAGVWNIP